MKSSRSAWFFGVLGSVLQATQPQDGGREIEVVSAAQTPETLEADAARQGLDRALSYLLRAQHPDGSWGNAVPTVLELGFAPETFYDWNLAANALVVLTLLECEPNAEREAALGKSLAWFVEARLPRRGDDWDNDQIWSALYGLVLLTRAESDPRCADSKLHAKLVERGRSLAAILVANQVPDGGWGYYDDPPFTQRPKWATSFSTACALPAVRRATELGWIADPHVLERARKYVERCRLPNGAYEYDLKAIPRIRGTEHINLVPGSLGRIQVCNWALSTLGVPWADAERLRTGLDAFFKEHRYLDAARLRPIPHEAYFANAGYFYFFGHYYAALAIERLPNEEREAWHRRLRPHLIKTMRPDGSAVDFLDAAYDQLASTAFLALALQAGLEQP